jgi:phage terminase small subunit
MLTAKQMKFVEEIGKGGSQSNAYRKAYDTSQMAPKTIWEEASRLRRHPKVAARIVELEAEKEARRRMQALSRGDRVLQELEKIAFGDGPASGRLKAVLSDECELVSVWPKRQFCYPLRRPRHSIRAAVRLCLK